MLVLVALGPAIDFVSMAWHGFQPITTGAVLMVLIQMPGRLALYVLILIFLYTGRRRVYFLPQTCFPACAVCGYNLTGLNEPRCPECGSPFGREELENERC